MHMSPNVTGSFFLFFSLYFNIKNFMGGFMTEKQLKELEKRDAIIHDGKIIWENLNLGDLGNIQYALAFVVDKLEDRTHHACDNYRMTLKKIDNILLQF